MLWCSERRVWVLAELLVHLNLMEWGLILTW